MNNFILILLTGLLAGYIAMAFVIYVKNKYSDRKDKEELEKWNRRLKREKERRKSAYTKYKEKYGCLTKVISVNGGDISSDIAVFSTSKKLLILGKEYDFKDVIDCTVYDDSFVKEGNVYYETRMSTGDMIGRALVGGALAGSIGAVIGGVTAKRDVYVFQEDNKIIHDYTVVINVNDIKSPIINIRCWDNEKLANDIVDLMNVVIGQSY